MKNPPSLTRAVSQPRRSAEASYLVGPDGRGDHLASRVGEGRLQDELPLACGDRVVAHAGDLVVGQRRLRAYDKG